MINEKILSKDQILAVSKMKNGCILNGDTGSGKSRAGIFYYFKQQGGNIVNKAFTPMKNPKDLYIITTAVKRDKLEFNSELAIFGLAPERADRPYIKIDSWNNIAKYKDIEGAFFIFDEDRVTGKGVWVKTFLRLAKNNDWIILSATPGDNWEQYVPVFIANGFFRSRREFEHEHVKYVYGLKFKKVERYFNEGILLKYKKSILVNMSDNRPAVQHHIPIITEHDQLLYKSVLKYRFDPFNNNEPIENVAQLCYILRRISNDDDSRIEEILKLTQQHKRLIIFYTFDYEREALLNADYIPGTIISEWNGKKHQPVPPNERWVYLVQYAAGSESWNCVQTDAMAFYSQTYSYKTLKQSCGRIDRVNTPFKDLYYYHLRSRSSIDNGIFMTLKKKKKFNENKFIG